MSRLKTLAAALALCATAPLALAENGVSEVAVSHVGPVVGQKAPSLAGVRAVGTEAAFAVEDSQGMVIAFTRSADWCPYCKKQLKELNAATGPLAEMGWTLAALSYDDTETLKAFAQDNAITYTLLSDEGSEAIRAFNLLNTDVDEDSRFFGIPHPAVVFVRNDGTVAAVLREEGYKTRPQVDAILEAAALLGEIVPAS